MWLEGVAVASIISSLKIQLSKDLLLSLLHSNQLPRSQCKEHQAESFLDLRVMQRLKNVRLICSPLPCCIPLKVWNSAWFLAQNIWLSPPSSIFKRYLHLLHPSSQPCLKEPVTVRSLFCRWRIKGTVIFPRSLNDDRTRLSEISPLLAMLRRHRLEMYRGGGLLFSLPKEKAWKNNKSKKLNIQLSHFRDYGLILTRLLMADLWTLKSGKRALIRK